MEVEMTLMSPKNFILRFGNEEEPIKMLTKYLTGKVFDFHYKLAEIEEVDLDCKNLRLSAECLKPIRLEFRGAARQKREYLVFVVDGNDDLLVSISSWNSELDIDFAEVKNGILKITNFDGDRYRFQIHET
jgi:hypothetical protein